MTLEQVLQGLMGPYGVIILLSFIIYAGYRGWWVWGSYARELKIRNERLEARIDIMAKQTLHSQSLAEKSQSLAESVVQGDSTT